MNSSTTKHPALIINVDKRAAVPNPLGFGGILATEEIDGRDLFDMVFPKSEMRQQLEWM